MSKTYRDECIQRVSVTAAVCCSCSAFRVNRSTSLYSKFHDAYNIFCLRAAQLSSEDGHSMNCCRSVVRVSERCLENIYCSGARCTWYQLFSTAKYAFQIIGSTSINTLIKLDNTVLAGAGFLKVVIRIHHSETVWFVFPDITNLCLSLYNASTTDHTQSLLSPKFHYNTYGSAADYVARSA